MPDPDTPLTPRSFSSADAKRTFLLFATLAAVGGAYWFLLPGIQTLFIPSAPGGVVGPWVIRPIVAIHAGAAAVMACVTVPLILGPLQRRWQHEDAALGTRYNPLHDRPLARAGYTVKGWLLVVIYAFALVFYLFSWTTIGPDGIEERVPWTTRTRSFQNIKSLETIPVGQRSDSIAQPGPWYSMNFRSGGSLTLSLDNEGTTPEELTAITSLIAKQSGLAWLPRPDARPE
jgi:hypothetical protein